MLNNPLHTVIPLWQWESAHIEHKIDTEYEKT